MVVHAVSLGPHSPLEVFAIFPGQAASSGLECRTAAFLTHRVEAMNKASHFHQPGCG